MKNTLKIFAAIGIISVICSGCATIFGGPITPYQKTKPAEGKPQREIRIWPLILDAVLFPASLAVDFATGAIYKPENKMMPKSEVKEKKEENSK